jgi:sugar phosphate isomerase/epimerase
MHPLWAATSGLPGFIGPLAEAGLQSVEFELHPGKSHWSEFQPLMAGCARLGLRLCFHAPYSSPYSLQGFCGERRDEIVGQYSSLLAIAEEWSQKPGGLATVVIHPAKGQSTSRAALYEDSRSFLEWVLEGFAGLLVAVENMGPTTTGVIKIGDTREEVLQLVTAIESPRLGICWDLGHDILHGRSQPPEPAWLARLVHLHVHDLDENGLDHYPLVFGRVPAREWLGLAAQAGMQGIATLELKGGQLAKWTPSQLNEALAGSLKSIRRWTQ